MINEKQLSLLSFGKKQDTGGEGIIIRDNLLFSIKEFDFNELFQIIYDCKTENLHYRQNLW